MGVQTPPIESSKKILHCVFAKCAIQALPKFYTGKRVKLYANFTFCFSFWGTASPRVPTGALPWTPLGDFHPQTPWPSPSPREPPPL